LSNSGISGQLIGNPNSESSLLDEPQYVESSDQFSDEHDYLSEQSIDKKDDDDSSQSSFEEEKEDPLKPGNTKKIDINSLSNNQRQALWRDEIDRLI
jgi:hypothetical protein